MIKEKISIIIPVYNLEKYISKCIESVIYQSYNNLEIIIINDGSTDTSGNICDCYAKKDNRIIVINQNNQGLSMARNNGLEIATGKYIGFVDGDDWIEFDMFELLYENLYSYNADISICNFNYINEKNEILLNMNGEPVSDRYNLKSNSIVVLENYDKMLNHINTDNNYVWNKLYKRYLFEGLYFPYNKTYEDIFISHELIDKAQKIVISPKYKYYYLQRENSITMNFNLNKIDMVEGYINRYNYLKNKYPLLEKKCRTQIFKSLLYVVYSTLKNDVNLLYKKEIEYIINVVKVYDIYGCDLLEDEEKALKLLFDNIRKYIIAMKTINKNIII